MFYRLFILVFAAILSATAGFATAAEETAASADNAAAAATEAAPGAAAEDIVVVATAPVAGTYYPVGGALCRAVNRDRPGNRFRCLVEATDGSADNLMRLGSGDADFALLQSDWQYHAYNGSAGLVDGNMDPASLRALFSMQAQPLTVLTRADANVSELADLINMKVDLGAPGSATRIADEVLLGALGLSIQDFKEPVGFEGLEKAEALCNGDSDALIMPATHPDAVVAAATEACGAKLIAVEGEKVDEVVRTWSYFHGAVIPGGLYPGHADPVPSFGLRATLVALETTPDELVYRFVRSVFIHLERLQAQYPVLADLDPATMIAGGNTAPLHAGALKYYKERGWR